ncbi:MAG: flagellar motor switch protein FliN [Spirochaetaceae bacterium]|jgi:flagellar motor switch protein FliN/FliY|nr:flagellar motor switch protein FliN [Spirochaetaceae bacterium]
MSDGALSQAEIDALLSGRSGGEGGAGSGGGGGNSNETAVIESFLKTTIASQSNVISMMTGGTVNFSGPSVFETSRDAFLNEIPDIVTSVKIDFTAGFPGEHLFVMTEDTAKSIASLMNKEENITLDEMAMSVIAESVSQMSGTEITALSGKTGNKSIASASPEAVNIPKAAVAMPSGNFVVAAYNVDMGDGVPQKIWEIFGPSVAQAIAAALNTPPAGAAAQNGAMSGGGGAMGNAGAMGGGAMYGGNTPAGSSFMQPVQFPNLNYQTGAHEQGNIGLLMDVYMEMTVELGRTRKLIKEILMMGEGTIIELDKLAGEPVDILVNHKLIAKGEVVVIDENFGVRVTEIISPQERLSEVG